MKKIYLQLIITFASLLIAGVHVFKPEIKIDDITVYFILLSILPWLGNLFKSVELPGGLKIEYNDIKNVEKSAIDAGVIKENDNLKIYQKNIYSLESISKTDPNLALSGLRISIENRLRELAKLNGVKEHSVSLIRVLSQLKKDRVLIEGECSAIEDILPLLNKAAHGANIDARSSSLAIEIGVGILKFLDEKTGKKNIIQLVKSWENRDGSLTMEVGEKLSKSFIKSPLTFIKEMTQVPDNFQSWLNTLESHTFTIYSAEDDIDELLYTAFYEELKKLMLQSANECINSEYNAQACAIIKSLNDIEIRHID